ncbi:MAG: TDP-N-acetylfucosamine:lipid II N-acetylfucosaminyltransferase, partial [Crocinitomicaceae bacterium]|nr:TDP-N-acetylfucosamine:lipid II N-acetylfucosaminyltransferase [Crocinitomicaceae bacterium]
MRNNYPAMNLHLFIDPLGYYSSQFAARVNRIDPLHNTIVNISIPKVKHEHILYFDGYKKDLKKYLNELSDIKRVYYHFYTPTFARINHNLKKRIPKITSVWAFWGGDFFSLPEFQESKFMTFSKNNGMDTTWLPRSSKLRQIAVDIFYGLQGKIPYNHKRFIESIREIDVLAVYFRKDYEIIVKYCGHQMQYVKFPYLSLDLILGDSMYDEPHNPGSVIMVGHSADPGLNHFEILEQLDKLHCTSKILVPVNYGKENYRIKLQEASRAFKLNIEFLTEYLPLKEYNHKLREVGHAIFNVNHQQAFGNIITLIWFGVKVFLHPDSSI